MLTLTSPFKTPLHRLPAGAKLAALAVFTVVLFAQNRLEILAAVALLVAGLHLIGGPRLLREGARLLWPLWPFALGLGLWHLWQDDLRGGAILLLRMATAVAAANLVTMTTSLAALLEVIERLCRPLSPLIAPRRLALAFALVLRFVPRLREMLSVIELAYRARAPRRAGWRVVVPALIAALDDADHAAEALRARGGA